MVIISSSPQGIPIFVLRLIALGATVTAAVVMVSAHDSARVFNMTFEAKYSDSPTFKYYVIVNAVVAVYTLLVLFCPTNSSISRFVLIVDLIVLLMLVSGISANVAIGQVGKNGNEHAGWLPICKQVPKFCEQTTIAVVAGFVGAIAYIAILLCTLHNQIGGLFSVKD